MKKLVNWGLRVKIKWLCLQQRVRTREATCLCHWRRWKICEHREQPGAGSGEKVTTLYASFIYYDSILATLKPLPIYFHFGSWEPIKSLHTKERRINLAFKWEDLWWVYLAQLRSDLCVWKWRLQYPSACRVLIPYSQDEKSPEIEMKDSTVEKLIFDAGGEADREVWGSQIQRVWVSPWRKLAGWGSRAGEWRLLRGQLQKHFWI